MAQRRFHYEQAFEHYLRANRVPYVAVDEAKKALLPQPPARPPGIPDAALTSLKSFDFVVYGPDRNLLLDVKGRKHAARCGRRLENWVTLDDVECLDYWARLFGEGFTPTFVFVYWCAAQPPDGLFEEIFEYAGRWYALREMPLEQYRRLMTPRSRRWRTVSIPGPAFNLAARPFSLRNTRPTADRRHPPAPGIGRLATVGT